MKSFLNILKIASLIALLALMTLGYLFFRTWQKNERPTVLEAQWQESEVVLGGSATIDVTLRVPWHREIDSANPLSFPETLLPVRQKTSFRKGGLNLNGHRKWFVTIPFVATAPKVDKGLTVSLPLARTKRISPSSVNILLPPLSITSPTDLPRDPENPNAFLLPEPPPLDQEIAITTVEKKHYWVYFAAAAIALALLLFFLLRKAGIIASTPPWEKAMVKLNALDESENSVVFLSKLSDILKQYTSERFEISASAKTSTEFLALIRTIEELPAEQLEELPWLARVADAAKFAGIEPPADASPRAMGVVRGFIEKTTPEENPDA